MKDFEEGYCAVCGQRWMYKRMLYRLVGVSRRLVCLVCAAALKDADDESMENLEAASIILSDQEILDADKASERFEDDINRHELESENPK